MYTIILILHTICCILLVAVVLLQVGRGKGMMGFLGSGTAESLFGSRTGDVLTRSTTVIAVLFMVTSLSLAYISVKKGGSVMKAVTSKAGIAVKGEGTAPLAVTEDKFTKKGSELVEKAKRKLTGKIPKLTREEEKTSVETKKTEP